MNNYCSMCIEFTDDGVGFPEDHDSSGYCFASSKMVEPNDPVCIKFKSKEKVEIKYDIFVDILVELNKAINACGNNGHGNEYMWRVLSDIEFKLKQSYYYQHKLSLDIKEKLK